MSAAPHETRARMHDGGLLLWRVAGVPVLLSASWWVGAALIVLLYTPLVGQILPGVGIWPSALLAAAFTVLLAASVLLHELGHCLVALRMGMPVRRIRLFLLGGISEITRTPLRPAQEGLVAAAGPVVSILITAVTGAVWLAMPSQGPVWLLVAQTCVANLAVAVFNLLPGLPLDGGRMLRAAAWAITGRRPAGTTAALIGSGFVVALLLVWVFLGVLGETDDQWLRLGVGLLMAWFVVAGANAERSAERHARWPSGVEPRDLVRPVLQLPAECPVSDALVAAAGRGVVLVRADGIAVGLLDQTSAERLAAHAPKEPAERAAEPVGPETVLLDSEPPEAVLDRVREVLAWQFLVVDANGRPTGVLRREDVRSVLNSPPRG